MVEAGGFEPPSSYGFPQSSTCVSVLLTLAAASRRRPLSAAASALILCPGRRRAHPGLSPLKWRCFLPRGLGRGSGSPMARRPLPTARRQLWFGPSDFRVDGARHADRGSLGAVETWSPPRVVGVESYPFGLLRASFSSFWPRCWRARASAEFWTRPDRKMLWSPAASSDQQRARVLTGVKAGRCAPPPLRGADGLDAGLVQTGSCRRCPLVHPYMLWSTLCSE